ncbi:hypothetical protein ZIOFF_075524 [Zingiber officinale]|uniref:Uncharacterized protein n=1 Tax=Zingiber officinale TaxID=94328 RepID=A0A8J5BTP4_ZINOF|nr:hypothetical protein ZIOFF_075524 [Zingiber officinale]
MVRLVFRPYTQVRRTICTSVSLRASTRVSSSFASLRHSSPSFGSRQACSSTNPSQKIWVGRRCAPRGEGLPPISFLAPSEFSNSPTRTHVRLLGPCFKTGRMGSPLADALGARVPTGGTPMARAASSTALAICRGRAVRPGLDRRRSLQRSVSQAEQRTGLEPFRIRPEHSVDPHPLPSRQFQVLFDSLFKVLFIFPSRYLFAIGLSPIFSLGRNLPPNWGCIPKQPDSTTVPRHAAWSGPDGALTLPGTPFQGTWARSVAEDTSPDYNSDGFNRQILKLG